MRPWTDGNGAPLPQEAATRTAMGRITKYNQDRHAELGFEVFDAANFATRDRMLWGALHAGKWLERAHWLSRQFHRDDLLSRPSSARVDVTFDEFSRAHDIWMHTLDALYIVDRFHRSAAENHRRRIRGVHTSGAEGAGWVANQLDRAIMQQVTLAWANGIDGTAMWTPPAGLLDSLWVAVRAGRKGQLDATEAKVLAADDRGTKRPRDAGDAADPEGDTACPVCGPSCSWGAAHCFHNKPELKAAYESSPAGRQSKKRRERQAAAKARKDAAAAAAKKAKADTDAAASPK